MNNLLKTYKFSNFRVVKGNGCYLYTSDKRKLLDFSAGVAVNSLGYNHPVIKKALKLNLKQELLIYQDHKYMNLKLNYLSYYPIIPIKEMYFFQILVLKVLRQPLKLQEITVVKRVKIKSSQ